MTKSDTRTISMLGRPVLVVAIFVFFPLTGFAQLDGPRTYWPLPINTNVVSGTHITGSANAPFSVFDRVQGSVDIDSELNVLGYLRSQAVFGRTAHWQALLTAGSLRTDSSLPAPSMQRRADGLGDLQIGGMINIKGAPELPVREALRHEVDLSINAGFLLTLPTGSYDGNEVLNMGSNRYSARFSLPIVKSLSDWVPARRMTLEIMPSVVVFGDNDNSLGNTVSQDTAYSVELHLTRDMTSRGFVSFDYTWIDGGDQELTSNLTGVPVGMTNGIDATLAGVTLGYEINDNLSLKVSHMQTIDEPTDSFALTGSLTKIQLIWGWHDVLEPRRRFRGE